MGKILFVLEIPEPKRRKEHAPPGRRHKDATKYSRKQKHKARRGEAPDDSGASFLGDVGIRFRIRPGCRVRFRTAPWKMTRLCKNRIKSYLLHVCARLYKP